MRRSSLSLAMILASAVAVTVVARADDTGKDGRGGKQAPSGKSDDKDKGAKGTGDKADPAIRWAPTWREAKEEAAERNVAIFIHSHSST